MDNFKGTTIGYQGVLGSYSYECILQNFPEAKVQDYNTFEGAIKAVQGDDVDYALLPIENSIAGRVMDVHYLLARSGLQILAEYYHPIVHCLLAKSGSQLSDIKCAYSHPMALSQCRHFLHKKNIDIVSFADTAKAAKYVGEQDSLKIGAIASSSNVDLYNDLVILEEGIQDINDNTTRFFLLAKSGRKLALDCGVSQITAIFFTVENVPAALYKSLSGFATYNINVIKLESFMPLTGNGSARFYLEIDGGLQDDAIKKSLQELKSISIKFEILGTFTKIT